MDDANQSSVGHASVPPPSAPLDDLAHQAAVEVAEVASRLARKSEEARRLLPEVIDSAERHNLFELVVPRALNGGGHDLHTLLQVTRTLAHGCVASSWTLSFLMLHAWLLSRFPAACHDELFGQGVPLAPAPLAPTGMAERLADGSYLLTGRWQWATGVEHSNWVMVHALIQDSSPPESRFFVLRRDEVGVEDVWCTSGMRATGSQTVVAEAVPVPVDRSVPALEFFSGSSAPVEGDGLVGLPMVPVLALVASAPALGGAERAVDLYQRRIRERVLAYTLGQRSAEEPAAQMRLASARAQLLSTRAAWDSMIDRLQNAAGLGQVTLDLRVDARLTAAATVRSALQIVSHIAEGSGASVYFEDQPLQRIQRDLEVLKGHVIFDWDRTTEMVGKHLLGIQLSPLEMV